MTKIEFSLGHRDSSCKARLGHITTAHGLISTPIFMPVGTLGTVKGIYNHELENIINAEIILNNTYHLYLRPGTELIHKANGVHQFIKWEKPILTDSGGYQVYSLKNNRKITEKGVEFKSHIDGSKHFFTPESVIDIQKKIGADFIMAFDECTPYPCDYEYARKSMHLTHRWLTRCFDEFSKSSGYYGYDQLLVPILQGSVYDDLRLESARFVSSFESEVYAIGGLSVGEPHEDMYRITDEVTNVLPISKARYLMGVGTPSNLLECIALGIDMFDCVLPSRNARHGLLYTWKGKINIKNAKWSSDLNPIDSHSRSEHSRSHSKAYLRHLFISNESLGKQIATLHNLTFYLELIEQARIQISKNNFLAWKNEVIVGLQNKL